MRIHTKDTASYVVRDAGWLRAHVPEAPHAGFAEVWHYESGAHIAGDVIRDAAPIVCIVVDGDLEVDGDVYLCAQALVVRGEVRCRAFESWDSAFVIAEKIRAERDIAFTALGGAPHDIGAFEAPILVCCGVDKDDLVGSAAARFEFFIDFSDAPDGVGDAPLLEMVRDRTSDCLALLREGKPIWSLFHRPPSPRLTRIVELVRAGAKLEWVELQGKPAARITMADGSRQTSMLQGDERATLETLLSDA